MSEISARYKNVARQFTARAQEVPDGAWDNPAPCEGWVARDVVRHIVEWMPGFFLGSVGISVAPIPSVDADPLGAWMVVDDAIQSALDDPAMATREFEMQAGRFTVEAAVSQFGIGDVLVHTWDLARATGLDETLDAAEVHGWMAGVASMSAEMNELMRSSGQFGPEVDVPADADEQTRLLAFLGRKAEAVP